MGEKAVVKRYRNDEITVVWKPDVCIHSTRCFQGLPLVFDPRRRPWVDVKAAATAEIVAQVRRCPSGALSLEGEGASTGAAQVPAGARTSVEASPNGPLLIKGALEVKEVDGAVSHKEGVTAFCRCGSSSRKPYCDGSHARVGFSG